ncbi:LLM class flavin-dependent oxidoreductase [Micromonospora lupini]|uniref:LLM class flavin-dependent oxidoreductase n=1 Tax=Micromonospora lupini TaxID=285679 RepID=UPI003F4CAFE8
MARWTDASGWRGLLVFTDNNAVDPWAVAQFMIERTERMVPLVAAQPPYLHPYTAARTISSIGFMYGRQVDLNLVTGGNRHHLRAVGCRLDHDERYERLIEYATIIRRLLAATEPLDHRGRHYEMTGAYVNPPLPPELAPRMFVAGSSPACQGAEQALGAVRLTYPQTIAQYDPGGSALLGCGIRVGIIARETSEAAWTVAHRRYPADPLGERVHDVAARITQSQWHHRLSSEAHRPHEVDAVYWLYPFRAYKEFCPYLVGSYAEVGELLARYLELGVSTIILDVPHGEDDVHHTQIALGLAEAMITTRWRGPAGALS